MKYYINYHTGAGNEWIEGTLEEAMAAADRGAAYTQENITVEDESRSVVASRNWYGVDYASADVAEENPIRFGDYGYYADWCID